MRNFIYASLIASLTFVLGACGGGDDPEPLPTSDNRTVLVYIVSDNNGLESFAQADIQEMIVGMGDVDGRINNLLVYFDGSSTPVLYNITSDKDGVVTKVIEREYVEQVSTDPAVMTEVVKYVYDTYPANSYGLVFWSHGEGWIPYPLSTQKASSRWIGQDRGNGDDRMNIDEFSQVLQNAPHLDFIMFDACFCQSIEMAYAIRNYADYFIATPTELPGPGSPYDVIVPKMFQQTDAALSIASSYFDTYSSLYDGVYNGSSENHTWTVGVSISVIKSSELSNFASATQKALANVVDATTLPGSVFNYDRRRAYSSSFVGYYDMVQMMEVLLDEATFVSWKDAYDALQPYYKTTPMNYSSAVGLFSMEGTNGISHFIPGQSDAVNVAYRMTEWYQTVGLSKLGW